MLSGRLTLKDEADVEAELDAIVQQQQEEAGLEVHVSKQQTLFIPSNLY